MCLLSAVFLTRACQAVEAIPAHPGPILVLSVPSRMGLEQAATDFLATHGSCERPWSTKAANTRPPLSR